MTSLHYQQWLLCHHQPTTATNGRTNGSAMGATSAFNGFATGTHCKPVPLPFRCRLGIFGGWNIFGSERRQWELDVVFSHHENLQTSVLHLALYWRLLYSVGYNIGCFVFGFRMSVGHVCPFQVGVLCDEICTTKGIPKHL